MICIIVLCVASMLTDLRHTVGSPVLAPQKSKPLPKLDKFKASELVRGDHEYIPESNVGFNWKYSGNLGNLCITADVTVVDRQAKK